MTLIKEALTPCVVFGASGYAGVELIKLIHSHPQFYLAEAYVSEHSADAGKSISELYPQLYGSIDCTLVSASEKAFNQLTQFIENQSKTLIFMATPHEFSHDYAIQLSSEKSPVFDLSGAFRLKDKELYPKHYQFEHKYSKELSEAPYVLPEWFIEDVSEYSLISLPGCYPTASQLAIKPVKALIDSEFLPVINATSGVSGAGRKASLSNSFCELSLKPYGIFSHRHQPEIEQGVEQGVIFTPHVADFERGILATITMKLSAGVTESDVSAAFSSAYAHAPLVRLCNSAPSIKNVAHTPYCDLYWQVKNDYLVVISAIDNLLKGASSQAIQVANMHCHLPQTAGLVFNTGATQ